MTCYNYNRVQLSILLSENFSVILAGDLEQLQMIQTEINSSTFLANLKQEEEEEEEGARAI